MRIAVLEDDPAQSEMLQQWLQDGGHDVYPFNSGLALLQDLSRESYDMLILDWNLPDISGDEILRSLRQDDHRVPVLFVTSRDQQSDIVAALKDGADDYMIKPVRQAEMMARVDALLRRAQAHAQVDENLVFAPYVIDAGNRKVTIGEEHVELTHKEFDLTMFLFRNAGRLLSRGHILENVWGTRPDLHTRTVDTHVSRIRNKLTINPDNGWRLTAVYQHGYRLEKLSDTT